MKRNLPSDEPNVTKVARHTYYYYVVIMREILTIVAAFSSKKKLNEWSSRTAHYCFEDNYKVSRYDSKEEFFGPKFISGIYSEDSSLFEILGIEPVPKDIEARMEEIEAEQLELFKANGCGGLESFDDEEILAKFKECHTFFHSITEIDKKPSIVQPYSSEEERGQDSDSDSDDSDWSESSEVKQKKVPILYIIIRQSPDPDILYIFRSHSEALSTIDEYADEDLDILEFEDPHNITSSDALVVAIQKTSGVYSIYGILGSDCLIEPEDGKEEGEKEANKMILQAFNEWHQYDGAAPYTDDSSIEWVEEERKKFDEKCVPIWKFLPIEE